MSTWVAATISMTAASEISPARSSARLGDDLLIGGVSGETFNGGTGADDMQGGGGLDFATYEDAATGVRVSFATGGSTGEAFGDEFLEVEGLIGSDFSDNLFGDAGNNILNGGASTSTA